jgi:hypothetical protein
VLTAVSVTTIRSLLAVGAAGLLALTVAACTSPSAPGTTDDPAPTTPVVEAECPSPQPGAFGGAAVALDSAELLGATDLPADVCAYGSESGDSIWIIAEPYDATFPDRISAWLEPLGWTAEEVGTWGEGDLLNVSYAPPAGNDVTSAFAHAFSAYPESVSFNLGLDQEFLTHYGVEPGDELAIFAAWR